jgi:predicted alpha-1,2-mannosidase
MMPARFLARKWAALFALTGCALFALPPQAQASPLDADAARHPVEDVDPFIGVDWGGETFVGAAVPFGMVKVGPDMETFDGLPSGSGYLSSGRILGFSHLHLSGASGKYGNILVAPLTGPLDIGAIKSPRVREVNHPGYYAATLTRYQVRVELTATRRVAFHIYTFPASQAAHVVVDVAHCLDKGNGAESQHFLGGHLRVVSNREAEGVGRYAGGWNEGGEYRVYFDIVFDTEADGADTWSAGALTSAREASVDGDRPLGAAFDFHTRAGQRIQMKVGISFISTEQARRNIDEEIPGWNFAGVRHAAADRWDQALSKIQIHGGTEAKRMEFSTAMYHAMLLPSDRTGENPGWQSPEPYYDDYYTVWDTFRTFYPMLRLIAPERERDMIRSLIDIYRHTGYMPDARSGNTNGRTQGGSNADVVVADAFVKGLKGIDYPTAFQAMVKDATVPPADPQKEGRGGLRDYNDEGYVTLADERSGTRTVEYAYDDFAIAELACGLGHPAQADAFAARARDWENLWDSNLALEGFKGFLRPRNPDGSWAAPNLLPRGSWHDFLYEDDLWTYSLYAPQDVRRLIELAGGNEMFVRRLDNMFYRQHFDMTNEPGFLIPMLYDWAGRPDLAAEAITELLEKFFTDQRTGLPGNDDAGAMSSWFVFQSLGFYPNAGQDVYLIGTPSFPEAQIDLGAGKTLRIVARNLDSGHLNRFIQSATLNGKPLDTAWFRQAQIANGATLVLTMSSAPSAWGTTAPPPSMPDRGQPFCPAMQ